MCVTFFSTDNEVFAGSGVTVGAGEAQDIQPATDLLGLYIRV